MKHVPLLLVLLTGCGVTPNEIREAQPWALNSKQAPETVGHCISRNLENMSPTFRTTQRPQQGGIEIIGRGTESPVLVADIQPISDGSKLRLWLSHHWIGMREQMIIKLMNGC